jgi:hypothetical protein
MEYQTAEQVRRFLAEAIAASRQSQNDPPSGETIADAEGYETFHTKGD